MNYFKEGEMFTGRYKLEEMIGKGAFGEVWKAWNPQFERHEALKIYCVEKNMSRTIYGSGLGNYENEARILGKLADKNPHLVTIYEAGIEPKTELSFIRQELVEGTKLSDIAFHNWMKEDCVKFESEKQILDITIGLARGLEYLAENGILHNDLKPENVIVKKTGEPVIIDFGLGVDLDQGEIAKGCSVRYASKEVLEASKNRFMSNEKRKELFAKSDVYSLGVIFHNLLANWYLHNVVTKNGEFLCPLYPYTSPKTDWENLSTKQIQDQIVITKYRICSPNEKPYEIKVLPARLRKILRKTIEKDYKKRYSAREFRIALERYRDRWKNTGRKAGYIASGLLIFNLIAPNAAHDAMHKATDTITDGINTVIEAVNGIDIPKIEK